VTLACLSASVCFGQSSDDSPPIHWALAAFLGTGRYKLSETTDVEALRFEIRKDFTEPRLDDDGRRPGITLRVPVAAGHQGGIPTGGLPDIMSSVNTISVVPGIEFPILLGQRWSIKPLASVGYGHAIGSGESAWIYQAGIRSEYSFSSKKLEWDLSSSLAILGYKDNNGQSQQAEPLTLGLEARMPLESRRIGDDPIFLHWHVARTHYLHEAILAGELEEPILALDGEWEIGAAFSKGDTRLRLWKFSWNRVGIAIRMNTQGEFTGFRLNFRSLFNQ